MSTTPYKILPLAEADLDGYAHRIAMDNLDAALRLYDCTAETYRMLAETPYMGLSYRTAKPGLQGVRYFPIRDFANYLVFYQPLETEIDIIRILHARMKKENWL
jgi:plasmid stabilization system protein ParE